MTRHDDGEAHVRNLKYKTALLLQTCSCSLHIAQLKCISTVVHKNQKLDAPPITLFVILGHRAPSFGQTIQETDLIR